MFKFWRSSSGTAWAGYKFGSLEALPQQDVAMIQSLCEPTYQISACNPMKVGSHSESL
jgi:hypothetical protein